MTPELTQISQAQESLYQTARWLQACPDEAVPDAYLGVMCSAERLFRLEQQLMEAYDFPSRQAHLEQHARVLRGLHCVHQSVLNGESQEGRHAGGALLVDWLTLHRDTVDAVLSIWVHYCECAPYDPSDPGHGRRITAH